MHEIRGFDPGIGGVKLWKMLCVMFNTGWMPGRDSFLNLLRRRGLMQKPRRSRSTTNSNHRYHKWKNLIKGFRPTAANQLWQSDITYIDLAGGCCYLHLVTDAYSKKIVGWCLAESLAAAFTLKALRMAIGQAGGGDLSGLIHHSDRGIQYCCDLYVEELQKHGIQISMTEDYKPTDNALAERVNGIIKGESVYLLRRMRRPWSRLSASSSFTIASALTTASDCRHLTLSMSRVVSRKRCGKRRIIRKMTRVCRLIPNFAGGMEAGTLWRLCASSRLANHCSVFHGLWLRLSECQHFQENVNEIRNAVNDFRKIANLSSKTIVNHIRK